MADLFESYAADLAQLHRSSASNIETARSAGPEERRSVLRKAHEEATEAEELLAQMDIEVQGFPQSVRGRYATQLHELRAQVEGDLREIVRHSLTSDHCARLAFRTTARLWLLQAMLTRSGSACCRDLRRLKMAHSACRIRIGSHSRQRISEQASCAICTANASRLSIAVTR